MVEMETIALKAGPTARVKITLGNQIIMLSSSKYIFCAAIYLFLNEVFSLPNRSAPEVK